MYIIKTLNAISPAGLAKLPANQFEIDNEAAAPHGILVRSADLHEMPLPDSQRRSRAGGRRPGGRQPQYGRRRAMGPGAERP